MDRPSGVSRAITRAASPARCPSGKVGRARGLLLGGDPGPLGGSALPPSRPALPILPRVTPPRSVLQPLRGPRSPAAQWRPRLHHVDAGTRAGLGWAGLGGGERSASRGTSSEPQDPTASRPLAAELRISGFLPGETCVILMSGPRQREAARTETAEGREEAVSRVPGRSYVSPASALSPWGSHFHSALFSFLLSKMGTGRERRLWEDRRGGERSKPVLL